MNKNLLVLAFAATASVAFSQSFSEGFEGTNTPGTGFPAINPLPGWTVLNNSTPLNTLHGGWFDGRPSVFAANSGTKYAASNFQAGTGLATIDTWLMTPSRTLNNGDTLSFFTRTVNNPAFPDRLILKMSTNGGSSNIADFSTTLLTVNPNLTTTGYPAVWTQFSATVSGLGGPISGRFAFNYNAPNGGPSGANTDYIGVDDVSYTSVPEPASMAVLGLGAVALLRRRRK